MVSEPPTRRLVCGDADNLWQLNRFYKRNGHKGKARADDLCFWLEEDEVIVAALRLTPEQEYSLMRGVWVDKQRQREGLGSELIRRSFAFWPTLPCYCFPYAHLERFYHQLGFSNAGSTPSPPQKLSMQLTRYRARGEDLLLMGRYLPCD